MTTPIEQWMARYVSAWRTNDPAEVGALFTADATYRFSPWGDPVAGRDAIVAAWLEAADGPDDHEFTWSTLARDGDRHIVQGRTGYADGRTYENLWIVDLPGDGPATAFTEWYMESASKPLGPHA